MSSEANARLLEACALLSGAAALAYEALWMRALTVVLGGTAEATAWTLALFLGGLGLGAALFGRFAARLRAPLLLYAIVETALGIAGATMPELLLRIPSFSALLQPWLRTASLVALNASLAAPLIVAPAILMGATLPLLCAVPLARDQSPGERSGRVYAFNTAGAVLGALATGLVTLPALGLVGASLVAAAANLAAALLAASSTRSSRHPPSYAAVTPPRQAGGAVAFGLSLGALLLGAAGMFYEVAWFRSLTLVFGSTTEAFSLMLAAYLLGTAMGSRAAASRADRSPNPSQHAALVIAFSGTLGLSGLAMAPLFPGWFLELFSFSSGAHVLLFGRFAMALALMLPVTFLAGAAFPLLSAAVVERTGRPLPAAVGLVYGWSTAGAVAGAVAASLWIVPVLGPEGAIKTAVSLGLLASASVFTASAPVRRRLAAAVAALIVLTAGGSFLVPRWNPAVVASAVYQEAPRYLALFGSPQKTFEVLKSYPRLLDRHGRAGLVSVVDRSLPGGDAHLLLAIDGKVEASTGGDMPTQVLVAHLPLALTDSHERALVIGLASGVTAGSVASDPHVRRLDVVEIEPAVIEAARWFGPHNRNVLSVPRLRISSGDGRSYLVTTGRRYDAIISEPSNPWLAGSAFLFTREFWSLCRDRLTPGGIVAQWIQLYALPTEELRRLVRTFASIFPESYLFQTAPGDAVLIGLRDPRPIDYETLEAHFAHPLVREDLARIGIVEPAQTLSLLRLGPSGLRELGGTGPLNTDEHNRVEFAAARALYLQSQEDNARLLLAFAKDPWKEGVRFPSDPKRRREALLDLAESDIENGLAGRAEDVLNAILHEAPSSRAYGLLGNLYVREGSSLSAEDAWRRGIATDPDHADRLRELLAEALLRRGRYHEALDVADELPPSHPASPHLRGLALFGLGRFPEAARLLSGRELQEGQSFRWAFVPFYGSKALERAGARKLAREGLESFGARLGEWRRRLERADPAELGALFEELPPDVVFLAAHESADEALAHLRDRVLLPLSAYVNGVMHYALGRDDDARAEFEKSLALTGDDSSPARLYLRALSKRAPEVSRTMR